MVMEPDISNRIILDLCGGTGAWSRPYKETGYKVKVITWPLWDVRLWPSRRSMEDRKSKELKSVEEYIGKVHGILAAPVCTVFSNAGAKYPRTDEELIEALSLVDACYRIANVLQPHFFCMENPVGKLRKWYGPPAMSFQPCDYGDPYTKRTLLWGWFNRPIMNQVEPTEGSKMWKNYGGKSSYTKQQRSITPSGFAKAFFEANQ